MKHMFAAACLATAVAVGLSAQSAGQTQPQAPSDKDAKMITLTGCVRAGEESNSFVLTGVKLDNKEKGTTATGTTTGTSGTAIERDLENATIRLINVPADIKLNEHLGHTVQVTGTLAPAGAEATSRKTGVGTTGTTVTGTTGEETGRRAQPEKPPLSLNVRTVTMVSATCDSR